MRSPAPLSRVARPAARRRLAPAFATVAIVAQILLAVPVAQAGAVYPNPPNATPVAWPSSFTSYTTDTGAPISDVEGESGVGSVYDISSGGGSATSVLLALSGGAAFFRARVGSDPTDTSKGGFGNATWLVLIATEDSPGVWTTKAVTGVDGKPVGSAAAPDKVYVGNAPGTGITDVYEFNTVAPAYDPMNAVGTGARVVSAGGGQYFIDWQVPVSSLVTASGGAVTASTPVRLFFGSSAAANLATINKDYMTGAAVSFANLGTVVLSPPTLGLVEGKTPVSGPNPPQSGATSVYDITISASNAGGSNLLTPSITVTMPAGVSIVSQTTATGSIGVAGQVVTWSPGTMAGGATAVTATIRVSVTPGASDVGTTLTLAGAAAGTGTDGVSTITGTGTAQTAGPVADAPHTTSTAVSCPAGPITYGDSATCTITVSDLASSGATVPTGTLTLSGTLGTATACTLAAATASTATCAVTFTATGVGSGSLGGSYAGDSTHAASSGASGTITIGKHMLTVTTVAATKTYGAANPSFSVSYSGFVLGDTSAALGGTLSFSTAATSGSPVGTYAVTPSGLASVNYAFSYVAANLTVGPAALTITADDQARAYGAANPTLTASYGGFVNGDDPADLTTPAVVTTGATAASPAGTYPITVAGATSSNYTISFVPGTLTIGKATLTVTAVDASRVYGASDPTFTVSISGFQNGDDAADLGGTLACSTTAVAASPVGTYPITCLGYTSSDYAIVFVAGSLAVTKATLTVTPDLQTRAYGAANPAFSAQLSGFVNGDTAAVVSGAPSCSSIATPASAPGSYPITCTVGTLAATNYAFDVSGSASLTVTTAALTITADDQSRAYGAANPALTAAYSGFVNGDDPSDLVTPAILGTAATPASPAGTYPITASGATSPNYTITFVPGTLTITKGTLTVTADDASRTYGAADPTFTAQINGFQNGDDAGDLGGPLTCTTTATAGSPVGTYPITCSGLTSADYSFSYVGGQLTIGPATISVTPDPQSRAYGAANPALTVSYGGFVNGDTASVLSGAPSCSTPATPASPTGSYSIACTLGTLSATNYVFDLSADGSLSVTTATLTITTDSATKVYGSANPAFTASIVGFQNGDTIAYLGGSLVFATAADASSGVGSYPVTPSGVTSSNYAISFVAGSLSVTKATLTVTPQNAAISPGDPIPTSWATDISGFMNGDDSGDISGSAACATDAVFGDPAGTYTITCTLGTLAAANYDFVIGGTGIFTIGTVTLHVTVLDSSKAYGDPNPAFTVMYSGFVGADDESSLGGSLIFTTAATTGSPVGTYPVSASGLTSPNYLFDYVDGTLTISQATQSITFGPLSSATYGDGPFDLTATSSSGLTVTFSASGTCSVSGVTVTITGAGSCTITAHQSGDANHAAAPDVPRTFTIAKGTPILTWATPADITYGTGLSGTQLNAVASVGGGYVYTPAGGTVLPAGTHTLSVTFTPSDSANYATISTTVQLDVLAVGQTIDFPALDDVTSDHDPITLGATASSGLPVTYTTSGPCTVVGNVLTITGTGTCSVTAHQVGDPDHAPALPVTVSFEVSAPLASSIDTDTDVVSQGGHVTVTASGFLPGSTVEIRILPDGAPVSAVADANGEVEVVLDIPRDTPAGPLVIAASGVDPNGATLDLTTTIEVLALPSTSTAGPTPDQARSLAAITLTMLGLLAFMLAAGVNALDTTAQRRRRS
jgi:hypothetical protein